MYGMLRVTLGVLVLTSFICRAHAQRQASTEKDFSAMKPFLTSPTTPSSLTDPKLADSNAIKVLRLYCPYSNICQQTREDVPDKMTSCCTSCSCDPSCSDLGNCCDNRLNVDRKRSCYDPFVTNERQLPLSNETGYWLVDRCSNSSSDTHCKSTTSEPWGSMYPVYDAETDVSYFNLHCAKCNGVKMFTYWDVGVSCMQSHVSYSNAVIVGGLLGKGCEVTFTPPRGQLDKQVCYTNLIQQCNITGLWKDNMYNAEVEAACSRVYSPTKVQGTQDIYANVFCILCNGMHFKKYGLCETTPPRNDFNASLFTTAIDYRKISSAITEPFNHKPQKSDEICRSHMAKHPFKVT